ncbi:PREDICTED: WASH complex subunit FAM21-like, partial [Amphimedon queenslandica]|uniref:Uncharacterized protein n=2 Tax=Amphimedon queenslandica TaxID=400682 RepID=A0AAN0K311_AMPQE
MSAPPPPPPPPVVSGGLIEDTSEPAAPSMEEKPASKPVEGAPPASGKVWERPWSIAEMKEGSRDWTLASDAGMLLFLKEFSQHIRTRTHEIEKQVDTLVDETKGTGTRMNNMINDFLILSNIQFVENRVFEENNEAEAENEEQKKEDEV